MLTRRTRSDLLDTHRHFASQHGTAIACRWNHPEPGSAAGHPWPPRSRRSNRTSQPRPLGTPCLVQAASLPGFGEGEPLVAEVGDYLQAPAECLNGLMPSSSQWPS